MNKFEYMTRKQAGVIFAAYKRGNICATEEHIDYLYNKIVGRSIADMAQILDYQAIEVYDNFKAVIKAIFANDYELANVILIEGRNGEGFWSYEWI